MTDIGVDAHDVRVDGSGGRHDRGYVAPGHVADRPGEEGEEVNGIDTASTPPSLDIDVPVIDAPPSGALLEGTAPNGLAPLTGGETLPAPFAFEIPEPPETMPAVGSEITDFLRFSRAPSRRLGWRPMVVVALVALAVGVVAWQLTSRKGAPPPLGHVTVISYPTTSQITITNGAITLSELRQSLDRSGHASLISTVPGGAVEVKADILVGRRADLTIAHDALLLRSDPNGHVALSAEGGDLTFDDDTVASWTPQGAIDTDAEQGRADIVATGHRAELSFTNSKVVGLGTGSTAPAVSWKVGASGRVVDSEFTDDWRSVYAFHSGSLTIRGSSFDRSQEDGALLLSPGVGSSIVASSFSGNAQSGLEIDGAAHGVTLDDVTAADNPDAGVLIHVVTGHVTVSGGRFYDNHQAGISATGGVVTVSGSTFWSNQDGLSISGGHDTVTDTDLSANTQDGLYVTGATTSVTATSDRIDHNSQSGIWVSNGQVSVASGLVDQNLNGIRVAGFSKSFRAVDNTITNSTKDGIALDVAPGIEIEGNVISNNGNSAISTNKPSRLKEMLKQNSLSNNQTATRIRSD